MTKAMPTWTSVRLAKDGRMHKFYYPEYVDSLQARIDELESENAELKLTQRLTKSKPKG